MSTEGQVPEGTTEPADTVSAADYQELQTQFEALQAERDAAVETARVAEENKTRANREAAERRVTNKSLSEELAASRAENNRMWVSQWVDSACASAGVPSEIVIPWLSGRIKDVDVSDRQSAVSQIEAGVQEFAEKFPSVVVKVDPTPDAWGTPEADGGAEPRSDAQQELERIMREEPDKFEEAWARLGGDELMKQGAFV